MSVATYWRRETEQGVQRVGVQFVTAGRSYGLHVRGRWLVRDRNDRNRVLGSYDREDLCRFALKDAGFHPEQ